MDNNSILYSLLFVFVLLGWATPYIYDDFGVSSSKTDIEGLADDIGQGEVGGFEVFGSIVTIFFWNFFGLPVLMNVLLFVPRIMLYVIIYDKVRGI